MNNWSLVGKYRSELIALCNKFHETNTDNINELCQKESLEFDIIRCKVAALIDWLGYIIYNLSDDLTYESERCGYLEKILGELHDWEENSKYALSQYCEDFETDIDEASFNYVIILLDILERLK